MQYKQYVSFGFWFALEEEDHHVAGVQFCEDDEVSESFRRWQERAAADVGCEDIVGSGMGREVCMSCSLYVSCAAVMAVHWYCDFVKGSR